MTPAPEGANLPPQDLDAEEAVLGAMMINDQAVLTASEIISDPGEFYREAHGTVYRAIIALLARSEPIDAVTVSDELERMGALEQVGGRGFIFGLSSSVTVAANVKSHAQIVRDLSLLRRVAAAGLEIAELGYARQGDVRDILDRAESAIFDVAQSRTTSEIVPIGGLLGEEIDRISAASEQKGLTGASSGLRDLDKITSGFQNSNLIILAARPAMGKTSLALGIARHLGVNARLPVVVFSLEMSSSEMKEPNLGLIMIDYLQLMSSGSHEENRVQEISQISRQLKVLARDLNVPVIALSQLSRGVESRTDKRPLLSDLRESGSIEQDADVVMFIYRDDYYNKETSEKPGTAELIVAKHRNGAVGTVDLAFMPHYTTFADLARGEV